MQHCDLSLKLPVAGGTDMRDRDVLSQVEAIQPANGKLAYSCDTPKGSCYHCENCGIERVGWVELTADGH